MSEYEDEITIMENSFLALKEESEDNSMPLIPDSAELNQILTNWGLESLYSYLKNRNIDSDALKCLNYNDIEQLFAGEYLIGLKARFRDKLIDWRRRNNYKTIFETMPHQNIPYMVPQMSESMPHQSISTMVPDIPKIPSRPASSCSSHKSDGTITLDVESVLKDSLDGQEILMYFKKYDSILPKHQQKVANLMVDCALSKKGNAGLSMEERFALAKAISAFFKTDDIEIYYQNGRQRKRPSGFIHHRYYNQINKRKILKKPNNKPSPKSNDSAAKRICVREFDEKLTKSLKQWLTFNDCPIDEVKMKWKESYPLRRSEITKGSKSILTEWPLFRSGIIGKQLIELDFGSLYPNQSQTLFNAWSKFTSDIIAYFSIEGTINDKWCQTLVKQLENDISQDSRDCLILLLLNALIVPRMKLDNKFKVTTIKDAIDCFAVMVKSEAEIQQRIDEVEQNHEIYNKRNFIQPILIVVGNDYSSINKFYIHFDSILFKFDTFLSSVDMCYKIFHVFNLQYPLPCYGSWLFIQKYFFNLKRETDQPVTKVLGLISYLKNLKS